MSGLTKKFNVILTKLKDKGGGKTLELEFEVDGNKREYKFENESIDIIIGRSEDSDVVIEHSSVSREHARIWIEDDAVWVEDLGSKNGTYLNDKKINGKHLVKDEVTFGSVKVKINLSTVKETEDYKEIIDKNYMLFSLITGFILTIIGLFIIFLTLYYYFL